MPVPMRGLVRVMAPVNDPIALGENLCPIVVIPGQGSIEGSREVAEVRDEVAVFELSSYASDAFTELTSGPAANQRG